MSSLEWEPRFLGVANSSIDLLAQSREKVRVAASSVGACVFLAFLKLLIGLVTGSLGILAEAAHSGLDSVAVVTTFFAVRISGRPADKTHQYGHGKVENLSALVETLMLLVTCGWIIYEAVARLFVHTSSVDPSLWAFLTMAISIGMDYWRKKDLSRTARKYNSQALEADALHFSTDIWSSFVVIVGLVFVKYGELTGQETIFVRSDALAALAVAVIVSCVSIRLGARAIHALLDSAPQGLAERIGSIAAQVDKVKRVAQVRVRGVGNQIFADVRIEIPRHLSFEESHAVANEVRNAVYQRVGNADVVVHTIPSSAYEGLLERIQAIASRDHLAIHNITTHVTKGGIWVDLDLEVDPHSTFEDAHTVATNLEGQLRANLGHVADINVHIEPRADTLVKGLELNSEKRARYLKRIEANRREISNTYPCEDIALHSVDGSVYVSLHLPIDNDRTIAQVHSIAEEMENRLRREFPELGRVIIHVEPHKKVATQRND
jgi:cation diffusion facilitator family transporter